jgi:hypothetical protein
MIVVLLIILVFCGCREQYIKRNHSSKGFIKYMLLYFFGVLSILVIADISYILLALVILMYITYNVYRGYKEA